MRAHAAVDAAQQEYAREPVSRFIAGLEGAMEKTGDDRSQRSDLTMLRYFQTSVPLREKPERLFVFYMIQELHRTVLRMIGARTLTEENAGALWGLIMSMYIFIDQVTRDGVPEQAFELTFIPNPGTAGWSPFSAASWEQPDPVSALLPTRLSRAVAVRIKERRLNATAREEAVTEETARHKDAMAYGGGGRGRGRK